MKHIYAKKYYLREKCLHGVTKHLRSLREVNRKETGTIIKATCQVLEKALNDQVVSVSVGAAVEVFIGSLLELTYVCVFLLCIL